MKQVRRAGRPPKNPESVRARRVVTFLTNAEWERLQRLSASRRQSLSATSHAILASYLSGRSD